MKLENSYEKLASYQKNGQENFLVMDSGENSVLPYQINMLRYNRIEGLLPVRFLIENGKYRYFYNISSREKLAKRMEGKKYSIREVRTILTGLYRLCGLMEDYLLEADSLLLHPEFIYLDESFSHVYFCFYPEKETSFDRDLEKLIDYFMNHLDYQDEESVKVVYSLYEEINREHYSLDQLMQCFREDIKYEKDSKAAAEAEEDYMKSDTMTTKKYQENGKYQAENDGDYYGSRSGTSGLLKPEKGKKAGSFTVTGVRNLKFLLIPVFGMAVLYAAGYFMIFKKENISTGDYMIYCIFAIGIVLLCTVMTLWDKEEAVDPAYKWDKEEAVDPAYKWDKKGEINPTFKQEKRIRGNDDYGNQEERFPESSYLKKGENKFFATADNAVRHPEETENRNGRFVKSGYQEVSGENGYEEISFSENPGSRSRIPATVILENEADREQKTPVLVSKNKKISPDIPVDKENLIIGKLPGVANACIYASTISRVHARIIREENQCYIIDLGSSNGTYINGEKIGEREKFKLNNGDIVALADVEYCFEV